MARAEVENLPLPTMPAAAAAEHFAAFKPADEHLLIRLGNIEAFTVHLLMGSLRVFESSIHFSGAG